MFLLTEFCSLLDVLKVDVVRVFGNDLDPAVRKLLKALGSPTFELMPIEIFGDTTSYEVNEMAELMRHDIKQLVFIIINIFSELNACMVLILSQYVVVSWPVHDSGT